LLICPPASLASMSHLYDDAGEDSSVGELIAQPDRRISGMHKLAALGGCAALVAVGYACGSWQVARAHHVSGDDFLNKAATSSDFGIAFSAATAGKTWSEIQAITERTKAGEGTLGAAYTALTPTEQKAFHSSATQSHASGGAAIVSTAPAVVPAKTATAAATVSTASTASATEAKELKAALAADNTAVVNQKCGAATWPTHTYAAATSKYYQDPDKAGVSCKAASCDLTSTGTPKTLYTADPVAGVKDDLACVSQAMTCSGWTTLAADVAASTSAGKYAYNSAGAAKYCKTKQCTVANDAAICLKQTCGFHFTDAICAAETNYASFKTSARLTACTVQPCATSTDKATCCTAS